MAQGIQLYDEKGAVRIQVGSLTTHNINANYIEAGQHSMNDITPHTQRVYGPMYNRMSPNEHSGFVEHIEVQEEEATWKVEVPDVLKEDIEAYLLGNILVVKTPHPKVNIEKRKTQLYLAEGETITSVAHELGVLTFKIDRPIKRIPLEIP